MKKETPTVLKTIRGFFNVKNIKDGLVATFKKREENKRTVIVLLIIIFLLAMMSMMGQYAVLFLYFRRTMNWGHVEYTRYTISAGVLGTISQAIIIPFLSSRLKWHDTTIMAIAASSTFANQFFVAFARVEWVLYVGLVVSILGHATTSLSRSLLSKLVGPEDVGKVFSVLGGMQALMPLVGTPFFGFLYRSTVETTPAAFTYVTAGICFVQLLFIAASAYLLRWQKRKPKIEKIDAGGEKRDLGEGAKFLENNSAND